MNQRKTTFLGSNRIDIEVGPMETIGRCYRKAPYTITADSPLAPDQIGTLRHSGFLGYGQSLINAKDWKESNGRYTAVYEDHIDSSD